MSAAVMAHGGPNAANALAAQQPIHSHIPGSGGGASSGYGAAPGTSYAALGADLLDKTQSLLNSKSVKNSASMPLVAMDLYGDDCGVAYFPPQEGDADFDGAVDSDASSAAKSAAKNAERIKRGALARSVGGYGGGGGGARGTDLVLRRDDAGAYRAVRRYLNKGEGHAAVLDDAVVVVAGDGVGDDANGTTTTTTTTTIAIPRPHLLLGVRKIGDLNGAARAALAPLLGADDAVIDRDDDVDDARPVSVTIINATDGNAAEPRGDDTDRVAFRLRLNSKKKAVTMLPEEALALVVLGCKRAVHAECRGKKDDGGEPVILEEDAEEDEGVGGGGGTTSTRIIPPPSPSPAGPPWTRP